MKTTTLVNPETQVNLETPGRIQQLKLGVDWHADHFRVVRMCDGQSPQPAQRFTPANFLPFVQKQLTLADQVFVVYEAGPGGFHLHRPVTAGRLLPYGHKRKPVVRPERNDPSESIADGGDSKVVASGHAPDAIGLSAVPLRPGRYAPRTPFHS